MEVRTVAISSVSSLVLSTATSPSSILISYVSLLTLLVIPSSSFILFPLIGASSADLVPITPRLVHRAVNSLIVCCILPSTAEGK
uniref:Uncharacterized protein n=1 Tax=Tanacetum cinerariifolium TaxID=118510 RepID=A0A699T402_TANCI|nr:hypothetical protein [Tanacetum cinerariifolium]